MANEGLGVTYHDDPEDVYRTWQRLTRNGGYRLLIDSDGNIHALALRANTMPFWGT
ncbi:hypothetical protein RWH43_10690 [Microbacterium sp. KSW2-21]|uniref:Uncharacterized protein n=1 Tax=Microbacterium algihabitans TaxID=3075992 RepID=A0ABU3RWG6_9MICO|nr:hypothetical protein [Microbacterium sp. KSW2-21]MDU0327221.1 hypothetical protein [Microbacterium sp. KSW2-21]